MLTKDANMPIVTRFECPKADWVRVVNAARRTWGKAPIDHEPSDKFKREIFFLFGYMQ